MRTLALHVTTMDGVDHPLEGIVGWRAMEVIRDSGLPINAECGGACACATCHVYVDPEWLDKLETPSEEEAAKLSDDAFGVEPNSRLSCQIILTDALDGLKLTLAPGSEP